jgi:adhesin transport system membrane fusion protein
MTASVEILTGRKTVLDYLLKPILRARERALRER